MKRLLLLRHAKSSWKDPRLDDQARPLNKRGKRDAPRMGALLVELGLPELVVTSTARRARSTARRVAEASGYAGEIVETEALYLAEPEGYLQVLRGLGSEPDSVLVVGHNPGIEDLVERLTGQAEVMPTAALAVVRLPVERWSALDAEVTGELVGVWRPKQLG